MIGETRGRKQNVEMISKVKDLKKQGLDNLEIADSLGITAPMVRYYLKQKIEEVKRRESLVTCFFRQPKEVQIRIAQEIGYILPNEKVAEKVEDTYRKMEKAVEDNESDLIKRCRKFLNGEIQPNQIEEFFNLDEMDALSKLPIFVSKSKEIFGGIKSMYSKDDAIEELRNNGF